MKEFLIPILISISAYLPIYINRKKISNFLGINDLPDGKRKIHKTPVPKTGAFPIAIIIILMVISNFFIQFFDRDLNLLLIFSLFVFCLGLFDDKFNLRARNKIFFILIISLALCTTADDLIINKFYIHTYDFFLI